MTTSCATAPASSPRSSWPLNLPATQPGDRHSFRAGAAQTIGPRQMQWARINFGWRPVKTACSSAPLSPLPATKIGAHRQAATVIRWATRPALALGQCRRGRLVCSRVAAPVAAPARPARDRQAAWLRRQAPVPAPQSHLPLRMRGHGHPLQPSNRSNAPRRLKLAQTRQRTDSAHDARLQLVVLHTHAAQTRHRVPRVVLFPVSCFLFPVQNRIKARRAQSQVRRFPRFGYAAAGRSPVPSSVTLACSRVLCLDPRTHGCHSGWHAMHQRKRHHERQCPRGSHLANVVSGASAALRKVGRKGASRPHCGALCAKAMARISSNVRSVSMPCTRSA